MLKILLENFCNILLDVFNVFMESFANAQWGD